MIDRVFVTRNMSGTLRRYRVVLLFLALGASLLLVSSAAIGQGAAAVSSSLSTRSAISSIRLDSMTAHGNPVQLNGEALDRVRRVDGVVSVEPWAQEGLMPEEPNLWIDTSNPIVFWATHRIKTVQPALVAGTDPAGTGEVILPDRVGAKNYRSVLGQRFRFSYTVRTGASGGVAQPIDLTVVGLYDNSAPGQDGDSAGYVSQDLEHVLVAARAGLRPEAFNAGGYTWPSAFVKVRSARLVRGVQAKLVAEGYGAFSIASEVSSLPRVLQLVGYVNVAIAVVLGLFCVGAGVAIGSATLAQRGREVGLLRALGWPRRRVFRAYLGEVALVGAACALLACAVGILTSLATNLALGGSSALGIDFAPGARLPDPAWLGVVLVGIPAALVVGAVRPVLAVVRVNPDDALRQL